MMKYSLSKAKPHRAKLSICLVTMSALLVSATVIFAKASEKNQTRIAFEEMAGTLTYLTLSSVLYDRQTHLFEVANPEEEKIHFQILEKVSDRSLSEEALVELLTHQDPKVRTLALVALYDREDPSLLPEFVKICSDDAVTFQGHPELSKLWLEMSGVGPPPVHQTVGDFATKMIAFYMESSGVSGPVMSTDNNGFDAYWKRRKDRTHCAGWFYLKTMRAIRGTGPVRDPNNPRIEKVRTEINQLPADEKAWAYLWLNDRGFLYRVLITDTEVLNLCRTLGRDKLMLMLQKEIPSDDPDLQPGNGIAYRYKDMQKFVLRHAEELLNHEDSALLLACEQAEKSYPKSHSREPTISPWWAVAAAKLDPENASGILRDAMTRFQGEFDLRELAHLYVALWQLGDPEDKAFVWEWFYQEILKTRSSSHRGYFISHIEDEEDGSIALAEIIQDERFDSLDWDTVEDMAWAVNKFTPTPIIPYAEIGAVRHPLGKDQYHWAKTQALEEYPEETRILENHLRELRVQLRACVPVILSKD